MAITNCTVFDSSYTQSYSVIDYPRCPDDLVKANIPSGSDQERFTSFGVTESGQEDSNRPVGPIKATYDRRSYVVYKFSTRDEF